jgi:hypothetical protein
MKNDPNKRSILLVEFRILMTEGEYPLNETFFTAKELEEYLLLKRLKSEY